MDQIRIRGARTHNLRNVSLDLPRNRLTVITGLSGSGKSSPAFDTLIAEGQRRHVESLSAYARQFPRLMEKPDVDLIEGLSTSQKKREPKPPLFDWSGGQSGGTLQFAPAHQSQHTQAGQQHGVGFGFRYRINASVEAGGKSAGAIPLDGQGVGTDP